MQAISVSMSEFSPVVAPCVLVVEDEFLIRIMLADHLRDAGFSVIEACDGDEAITILQSGAAIDLVLSDVRMPGATDGLALLAFVRRSLPDLPVVIMSGHLDPALALGGGASRYLGKPCNLAEITEALRTEIRRRA